MSRRKETKPEALDWLASHDRLDMYMVLWANARRTGNRWQWVSSHSGWRFGGWR